MSAMHRHVAALIVAWLVASLLAPAAVAQAPAEGRVITPRGEYRDLSQALAQAEAGDEIHVYGGIYRGPVVIDRSVTLIGHDWPVIEGGGVGSVVKIVAPDVRLRGFLVRGSGDSLAQENSGIAVEAPRAAIEGNRLEDTLFGIYLRKAPQSVVRDNVIVGKDLPVPRRGDAIRVWYSNDVQIVGNDVSAGRDVVLWYSEHLLVRGNRIVQGRYGLHFMYCDDALVEGNDLSGNSVGAFLMYSRRLHLRGNRIAHNRGPSGYGIGLKDVDDALVEGNLFWDNRVGAFLDNSPREEASVGRFTGNVFLYNDIGVLFMPSVRRNIFIENSFVDNQEQVAIAGGGQLTGEVWSREGRGNYWSDYVGFDLDGDGVGDLPYRSDRLFDSLIDRHPALRLFTYSPAAQAIELAARALPLVRPQPKLIDEAPLVDPVGGAAAWAWIPTPSARGLWLSVGLMLGSAAALAALYVALGRWEGATLMEREARSETIMIRVRELTKRYGAVAALEGLSFDVGSGEAVALWGPNGAGKTTAIRCILGVVPFEGQVEVCGHDVRLRGRLARQQIGFVPQDLSFHDGLSVLETLRLYARLRGVPRERVTEVASALGVLDWLHRPVQELSGGMRQRVALAVALLSDPPLLVLDEPTANLDAEAREQFLELLLSLREQGKTLLFTSHRAEEVTRLADRVLVLRQGKLVASGPPQILEQRVRLKLRIPDASRSRAAALLAEHGYHVSPNGASLRVAVDRKAKMAPITLLMRAGVSVEDFEVITEGSHE
ncbi:MAG: hypothetical protein Kow0047_11800 [Anaerolineae bacterium]